MTKTITLIIDGVEYDCTPKETTKPTDPVKPSLPYGGYVYFIGNSLSDHITAAPGLEGLIARHGKPSITIGRAMRPGTPLDGIIKDGGAFVSPVDWQKALTDYCWEWLSLQPFNRTLTPLDGQPGDLESCLKLIDTAGDRIKGVLIYETWPTLDLATDKPKWDGTDPVKPITSADWLTRFYVPYKNQWAGKPWEGADYRQKLKAEIEKARPGLMVRVVPVGQVMRELIVGGLDPNALYSDHIHLSPLGVTTAVATWLTFLMLSAPDTAKLRAQYPSLSASQADAIVTAVKKVVLNQSAVVQPATPADPNIERVNVSPASLTAHLSIPEDIARGLPTVRWLQDGRPERRGFNFATVGSGLVTCEVNGKIFKRYDIGGVDLPLLKDLTPGSLDGIGPGRYRLRAGTYTLSNPAHWKDVMIFADDGVVIEWRGGQLNTTAIATERCHVLGARFTNPGFTYKPGDHAAKNTMASLFRVLDDSTFRWVSADGFMIAWQLNAKPTRVLIESCQVRNNYAYAVWFEGSHLAIYDVTCFDSIFEHCIRGGPSAKTSDTGWYYVAVNSCELANPSGGDADPANIKKPTLTMQAGRFGYRWANRLDGWTSLGPLAFPDGSPNQFTEFCVVEDETRNDKLELWGGLRDSRVQGPVWRRTKDGETRTIDRVLET
jgi:hypothetical protein